MITSLSCDCPGLDRGFTLLHCLLVLALLGILTSLALPLYSDLVEITRIRTATRDLVTAFDTARASAISAGKTVTVCRSRDGEDCNGRWEEGLIVFRDENGDHRMNPEDTLLWRSDGITGYKVNWRSFGNRQYLQFTSMGLVLYQNGHFLLCPASADSTHAITLIINATGRIRLGRDTNHNGVVENGGGADISCT